ncbi:hypothetical protein ADK53_02400 [Streptomyces sp. WM6373]|nr:hypothetical protein ADK53_02400 [Streptomyces sp. WM6373]
MLRIALQHRVKAGGSRVGEYLGAEEVRTRSCLSAGQRVQLVLEAKLPFLTSMFLTLLGLFPLLFLASASLLEGVALAHSLRQKSSLLSRVIDRQADLAVQDLDAVPDQRQSRSQGRVDVLLGSVTS